MASTSDTNHFCATSYASKADLELDCDLDLERDLSGRDLDDDDDP